MKNNLTIGITGASGHVGSQLAKYLSERGFRVIAFARNITSIKTVPAREFNLTQKIPDDLFTDIDVLIHCAYVSRQHHTEAEQVNVNCSRHLFETAKKQGVKKIIFFSSVTANVDTQSGYAKSKFTIEQFLDVNRDFIIKCSMVVGSGGMFQRMLCYASTHSFIPVIGSGAQVLQIVAIDDVVRFVEQVIVRDLSGTGVLANEEELTYRQVFTLIAQVCRKKIFFVPVPAQLLKTILHVCNLLNIRTGASEENIQGLQTLNRYEPLKLLESFRTLSEKLIEMRDGSAGIKKLTSL